MVLRFQSPTTPEQLTGRTNNSNDPHQPVFQSIVPVNWSIDPGFATKEPAPG